MYHDVDIQEAIRLGMITENVRNREDREDIDSECWMELHILHDEIVEIEDAKDIIRKVIHKMAMRLSRRREHESEAEIDERMGGRIE
jgi:hypothetical protein